MTNKLKYFVANWKMFGDFTSFKIINETKKYISKNKRSHKKKIVFCVPNTLIHAFKKKLTSKVVFLGAQNCHHIESTGPFTGSVNASMLKKIGAQYIILGHSENRLEGETNKIIKEKIISSLNQNLNIIFCIGETANEKKKGKTLNILRTQINATLERGFNLNKILVAYEPVWSIGSNKIPEYHELNKIIKFIKLTISKRLSFQIKPKVLYGGSVNPQNITLFSKIKEIDGFLIGGASQSANKFIDIIRNYYK